MKKLNEITKGKAKSMFTTDNEDHLIMHFSDDTSAFDGKKREALLGKGAVNNQFNAFIMEHLKNNGIETLIHYPIPPHKQKAYKKFNNVKYPITESLSKSIISIPLHTTLTDSEINYIIDVINKYK